MKKPEGERPEEFKSEIPKKVAIKESLFQRCKAKCCTKDPNKKPVGFESNPNVRLRNNIKRLVNGRFVLTLMTFVTLFALIGVSSKII